MAIAITLVQWTHMEDESSRLESLQAHAGPVMSLTTSWRYSNVTKRQSPMGRTKQLIDIDE
jgi:hypothetical protein